MHNYYYTYVDTDSESESETPATPATPAGVPLPPPLRNIPHQTPDGSPTTSQLFSYGGMRPGNINHLPSPSTSTPHSLTTTVLKLPTRISVLPSPSRPNQMPFPGRPPSGMMPQSTLVMPTSSSSSRKLTPSPPVKSNANALMKPPGTTVDPRALKSGPPHAAAANFEPFITSTPKAKRSLFDDGDETGKLQPLPGGSETRGESTEIAIKEDSREMVHISSATDQNMSAMVVQLAPKKKTPRIPSLHFQSAMSQQSSSDDSYSESESISSSESDQSMEAEERDRFDPGRLTPHCTVSTYFTYHTCRNAEEEFANGHHKTR